MDLDKIEHKARTSSVSVGEVLDLIALVRKQEAALRAAPAAPVGTVDSHDFRMLLLEHGKIIRDTDTMVALIAHIDAHTAAAVAKARGAALAELHPAWLAANERAEKAEQALALVETVRRAQQLELESLRAERRRHVGCYRDAAPVAAIPEGWAVRREEDGDIVVSKHGVGGYVARRDDDNIASSILHEFATDILAATQQQDILRAVIEVVRQYPDFDGETPFGTMMDEALAGKVPALLGTLDGLAAGVMPAPQQHAQAAVVDSEASDIDRIRHTLSTQPSAEALEFYAEIGLGQHAQATQKFDFAKLLMYPQEWDVAAYPTIESAMWEMISCAKIASAVEHESNAAKQVDAQAALSDEQIDAYADCYLSDGYYKDQVRQMVRAVLAASQTAPIKTEGCAGFQGKEVADCGPCDGAGCDSVAPVASAAPQGDIEDPVIVPRGLLGAACSAIDKKRDAPQVLAKLRRYTVGDLSASIVGAVQGDAARYQRLRVIGVAPFDTPQLENGTVLRFQGLDAFVDGDLLQQPSRGEYHPPADAAPEVMKLLQDAAHAWNNEQEAELDATMERIESFLISQRKVQPSTVYGDALSQQAAEPENYVPVVTPSVIAARLRVVISDPMLEDYAEVSKALLTLAADCIDTLRHSQNVSFEAGKQIAHADACVVTHRLMAERDAAYQQGRAAGIEEAAKLWDNKDGKQSHISRAIRALNKTGAA